MRSLVLLFAASGCISMNTFETPRTLDAGELSHSISLTSYVDPDRVRPVPMPAYSLQIGVADRFDIGIQAATPGRLRVGAKYNPVRTEWFDAAIALGGWIGFVPHEVGNDDHNLMLGADLPILLGINLGPASIIPFAGPGVVYSPNGQIAGWTVRTGLGVGIEVASGVRLHPEVSTTIDPVRGEPIDYAFGMGVVFD
jgi:hypothetical protein